MYSRFIDFPDHFHNEKKVASPCFFGDLSNIFFDSYKVIHYSHVTRHIHEYAHNFCNKKVRKITEKTVNILVVYFITVSGLIWRFSQGVFGFFVANQGRYIIG